QRDGGYLAPEHVWRAEVPLLLLVVAAACVLAARLRPALARAHLAAVPAAALAAVTTPLALDLSFTASVALGLGLAALLVPAGALCLRRGWRQVGAVTLASGLAVLALTLCFAVAVDVVTLAALPVAALVLAAATVLVAAGPLRLVLGVAAGAVAIAEAAAITRFEGAGWPAVWSLALTLGVLAAAAAGALLRGVVRRGFAVAATALLVADAGALSLWSGGSPATAGLAVTVVAGLLAVGAVWLDALVPALAADQRAVARDVATTAAVGVVAGVAIAAPDADRLWLALLAAGVSAAAAALRPELHRLGWVAGAALTASSWVRLALSDVDAPEPYTVPAGVALLVLGAWRRRRDPSYSSWRAYGTGLTLALVPSLVRAVTDAGNVRPLLLAAAALVVLCSGIARRLQAPLVIGGLVLVVDALVQLAPYLAAVYDAVPRWSLFALAGLLLVVLGATYERRARELRALQQQIASFG
ncbi:MAG: SCO7613 C-terminal domain-containing membrane protein, partial [Actinomycetes bacterium]